MDETDDGKNLSNGKGSSYFQLLTVVDVARCLAVSTSLVYKLVEEESIPHYRFGKTIRFDFFQVSEWLKSKSITPTSTADSKPEVNFPTSNPESNVSSKSSENLMRDVDRILKPTKIKGSI